jgi:large subunit ribosomal protein L15
MNITDITSRAGRKPSRKRVGRGPGSGLGKTSGRGHKGQKARSGVGLHALAEGGAFPFFRRIPKVGFNNKQFRTVYQVVNVRDLEARFDDGGHVTAATLEAAGLIRDQEKPVKILAEGELKKKLSVEAERFSAGATKKIEAGGGTVTRLGPQPKKKFVKRPPAPKPKQEAAAEGKKKKGAGAEAGKKESKKKAAKSADDSAAASTEESAGQ